MEFGLLADGLGPLPERALQWMRGTPTTNWFSGAFKARAAERYHVATLRCIGCGFLELYAADEMRLKGRR